MSGTKRGGQHAAQTNKRKYGADFYKRIGAKGGAFGNKDGTIKGFAAHPELAREAGIKGGTVSRKGRPLSELEKDHVLKVTGLKEEV